MNKNLPISENEVDIESFVLVPWKQENVTQFININSMGKYYLKLDICFFSVLTHRDA